MRRKHKRGIHSNQTIKSCPTCKIMCSCCKSTCKVEYGFSLDDPTISENHPTLPDKVKKDKRLHHQGIGSLNPGHKFIFYSRRSHKHSKMTDKEWNTKHSKFNRFLRFDLSDQIRISDIKE